MTEEMTQAQKYHFRRLVEEIAAKKGMHTELVTVYVPHDKLVTDITSHLKNELGESANIKSKQTRKNVMSAIESMISRLKNYQQTPPNGLACFVGEVVVGQNQTKMFQEIIEPPQPAPTFYYRCDNKFFVEPLKDMLEEKEVYGLLLIDRREFCIGILKGKHIQMIAYKTSQVPGKHGRGGQSQRRFERATEEAANQWYKHCAEVASDTFLSYEDLLGIFVGGPGPSKRDFMDEDLLHHEIKKKVIEPYYDTGYTDEYGLRELAGMVAATQSQLSLAREKTLMQRLLKEITKANGGLAVYGEDHVRAAILLGALDTLIVSEDLRRVRLEAKCKDCGKDVTRTVAVAADTDLVTGPCPACGKDTLEVGTTTDVVEELGMLTEDAGGSVEIVGSDSEEGETLMRAFGGIAGFLRYQADVDTMVAQQKGA